MFVDTILRKAGKHVIENMTTIDAKVFALEFIIIFNHRQNY